ncbi:MAG: serine protease [Kovacikia sp.]
MTGNSWGSGILVQQQGQRYSVLTNHHVLNPGKPYWIQTPDNRIYPAELLDGSQFQHRDHFLGNDLEILQFSSPEPYAVASLNSSGKLAVGEEVFAAGFSAEVAPSPATEFVFTSGQISLLSNRAFVGGYRIGYTNLIRQGMSGGPLLNRQGEVVGINGLHAYPIWGTPYVFRDGSQPLPPLQTAIARASWAIPITTFVCLAPLTQMSLSVPINRQEVCSEE